MKSCKTRTKRVTDPFDDNAKARIVGMDRIGSGYFSSGSEHSAQADDDVTSSNLSEIFLGFTVDDGHSSEPAAEGGDCDSSCDRSMIESISGSADLISRILEDERDAFKKLLRVHVCKAAEIYSCLRSDKQIMRRNVMAYLRNCGYNAAVCKAKWENCGGLTAGSYEFVDVVRKNSERYFVDLDFAAEFEIARPVSSYELLLRRLPRIFVGNSEDLKQILRVVGDAARRSLKIGGLHMPPWRKLRFMQNKWLGPYRRTTSVFPAKFSSPMETERSYGVKCRAVGFDTGANGGHLLLPAATRTR